MKKSPFLLALELSGHTDMLASLRAFIPDKYQRDIDDMIADMREAADILNPLPVCTCMTGLEDDAYDPGGPLSDQPRPPRCTIHPKQDGKIYR